MSEPAKRYYKIFSDNMHLQAENARLKALTIEMDKTINISQAGYRDLKAEVELLTNNCNYLDQKLDEELDKSAMLCGQVERLTKAGDAMADTLESEGFNGAIKCWNAAKEGKPSV